MLAASWKGLCGRLSLGGLLGGLGFLTAADAPWAHIIGLLCLFACMIFGFIAVGPAQLATQADMSPPRIPKRDP